MWLEKDPQETRVFAFDWSSELGYDTVSTSSWAVPAGVTEVATAKTDKAASVTISGGTAGTTYTLTNTITTKSGRTLEKSAYLAVEEVSADFAGSEVTQDDVIRLAHRKIGVVSAEQSVSADQDLYAKDVLQGIWDEHGALGFSITSPGRRYYMALADLLASEIAPHYTVQGPSRSRALGRLRAILIPDDRPDARDLDENGLVSGAETAAAGRAAYY